MIRSVYRITAGLIAIGGSVAYAISFAFARPDGAHSWLALRVAVASGVCWPIFGVALLAVTKARPSAMLWADACLDTMCVGIGVLGFSICLNVTGIRADLPIHVSVLVASNVLMGLGFVMRAKRLDLPPRVSIPVWLLALDGPFVLILMVWR